MRRQRFDPYVSTGRPHYIALWDMQNRLVEHVRLEPDADLRNAMTTAMQRLELQGWTFENDSRHGSCFLKRADERRLLGITEQDPTTSAHRGFCPGIKHPTLEIACLSQVTDEFYLGAYCRKCKHSARSRADRLRDRLGGDYPVRKLRERLRCDKCGDKRQIVLTFLSPDERAGTLVNLFARPRKP